MVKFPAKEPRHPSDPSITGQWTKQWHRCSPETRSDPPACGWRTIILPSNTGLAAHSGIDKSLWRKALRRQMGCTRVIPCINTPLSLSVSLTHTLTHCPPATRCPTLRVSYLFMSTSCMDAPTPKTLPRKNKKKWKKRKGKKISSHFLGQKYPPTRT